MAFTPVENTRIALELATAFSEACPTVKQVFLDGTNTYAQNTTDLATAVAAVTAVLFNTAAPTVLP